MFWQLKRTGAGSTFSSVAAGERKKGRTSVDLVAGAIIGGTYKIERLIGAGGMGEVYRAQHQMLNKTCALKVIPPDQVTQVGWQRFQAEAKAIAKLDHINLVKVSDLGVHEGCLPYYAMEFIDGETLFQLVRGRGPLPLSKVLPIFSQICDGLAYAHRNGLVHRDLKPENIMLERSAGGKVTVKILDFGLVKLARNDRDSQSLTAVGEVFGSPFYMSPEQCIGGKIDNRTDIYSAGCMLFECLTGRPPFVAPSPVELITSHQTAEPPTLASVLGKNSVPESMDLVLAKLLRKNPVERYQTFTELKSDLVKVGKGQTVEPFYVSRSGRTASDSQPELKNEEAVYDVESKPRGVNRLLLAVGLVVLFVAGAGAFFLVTKSAVHSDQKTVTAKPTSLENTDAASGAQAELIMQEELNSSEMIASRPTGNNNRLLARQASDVMADGVFSGIVDQANGKKAKFLRFPKQTSLGRLTLASGVMTFAHGQVFLPVGSAVTFSPSVELTRYADYLKHFKPGDINAVNLQLNPDGDNNILLAACSELRGVKRLDLINANDLNKNSIPIIDKFESLESLRMVAENENVDAVAGLSALRKVASLSLVGDNLERILFRLRNNATTRSLSLHSLTITDGSLDSIVSLSRLEYLYLESDSLTRQEVADTVLAKLARSHSLQTLALGQANIGPNGIANLKKFPALQLILIGKAERDDKLREHLAQQLPGLEVSPLPPQ